MSYEDNRSDDRFLLDEVTMECRKLVTVLNKIADMPIPVVLDPVESRRIYLDLCFQMRDIARKETGKDYTVKIENGFACGPKGCEPK